MLIVTISTTRWINPCKDYIWWISNGAKS